jgi:hypothetical protein
MLKKHVAVARIDNGDRFYYTRSDVHAEDDPTLFSDGSVGFRVLLESDDPKECEAAVDAAFKAEGRDPVAEYLLKMALDLG